MDMPKYKIALIVGAGEGLSASLARLLAREGIKVALAARKVEKLGALCTETGARAFACDATSASSAFLRSASGCVPLVNSPRILLRAAVSPNVRASAVAWAFVAHIRVLTRRLART